MRTANCLIVALTVVLSVSVGDAAKRRHARKGAASKEARSEVEQLLGKFKWGMSIRKVKKILEAEVRDKYKSLLAKEKETLKQDRLRTEMKEELSKVRQGLVRFTGKATPWDVSLVDKQFAHNNNESMLVRWGHRARNFYFFHNDRLWKVYIAFNSELYRDKTFEDFAGAMERRFGKAVRKYKKNLKGESVLSHLEWQPKGRSLLKAIDNTRFYGNFCLVLSDRAEAVKVMEGRKLAGAGHRRRGDPLVDKVIGSGRAADSSGNEDVVDRLTGRGVQVPKYDDTGDAPAQSGAKRGRKGGNPLDGADL